MTVLKQLTWDNFRSTVFLHGQQGLHRVSESPHIEVFGDGQSNRIGIWLEIPPGTSIPPSFSKLEFIVARTLDTDGLHLLEVSTKSPALHRQFYHFALAVAERVIIEKSAAIAAVALELQCFSALFEEKTILGIEKQVGLLGELIFLERLLDHEGVHALNSWIGPLGEPHDFRIQEREFEVKTTLSPQRVHTINGADQLVPSLACSLYLISVLLGPAGAIGGLSLSEKIAQLSEKFEKEPVLLSQFEASLEACGFNEADRLQYSRRFALRRPLGLVRIDGSFPAITRLTIQTALGTLATRVESLQYDVNIEGLESEDGTGEFSAVVLG